MKNLKIPTNSSSDNPFNIIILKGSHACSYQCNALILLFAHNQICYWDLYLFYKKMVTVTLLRKIRCIACIIDLLSLFKCSLQKHKMAATVFFLHLTASLLSLSTSYFHKYYCIGETSEFPSFQRQLEAAVLSNLSPNFEENMDFQFVQRATADDECWRHLNQTNLFAFCKQSEEVKVRHILVNSNTL